jgi:hypothetical protein
MYRVVRGATGSTGGSEARTTGAERSGVVAAAPEARATITGVPVYPKRVERMAWREPRAVADGVASCTNDSHQARCREER